MDTEPATVILEVGAERLDSLKDEIVEVYREAFSLPPNYYDDAQVKRFAVVLEGNRIRPGFRFFAAQYGHELVGFCYGHTGLPGQFWHDAVCDAMEPRIVNQWLNRDFEICELAVLPKVRRNGVATELLQSILASVTARATTLSTSVRNMPALSLYRKLGWTVLLPEIEVSEVKGVHVVLGLLLQKE